MPRCTMDNFCGLGVKERVVKHKHSVYRPHLRVTESVNNILWRARSENA